MSRSSDTYDLLVCYSTAMDGNARSFSESEWKKASIFFLDRCADPDNVLASIHLRRNYPDSPADAVQLYEKQDVRRARS